MDALELECLALQNHVLDLMTKPRPSGISKREWNYINKAAVKWSAAGMQCEAAIDLDDLTLLDKAAKYIRQAGVYLDAAGRSAAD